MANDHRYTPVTIGYCYTIVTNAGARSSGALRVGFIIGFYHAAGIFPEGNILEFLCPNKFDAVAYGTDERKKVTHRTRRAMGNLAGMFDAGKYVTRKKTNREAYIAQ